MIQFRTIINIDLVGYNYCQTFVYISFIKILNCWRAYFGNVKKKKKKKSLEDGACAFGFGFCEQNGKQCKGDVFRNAFRGVKGILGSAVVHIYRNFAYVLQKMLKGMKK